LACSYKKLAEGQKVLQHDFDIKMASEIKNVQKQLEQMVKDNTETVKQYANTAKKNEDKGENGVVEQRKGVNYRNRASWHGSLLMYNSF
jgi:GH15 family glucan-1,4-alpha-glucosidase